MRTALLSTLTFAAFALTMQSAHADVYRYTDDKGNVLYTDKPSTLPAERLDVKSKKTDVVAAQERQDADMKRMGEASKVRQQADTTKADEKQASELTAKDKAERCVKARDRYDRYMNARNIYETLPNNERRYLTDAELDAQREAARVSMETLCK